MVEVEYDPETFSPMGVIPFTLVHIGAVVGVWMVGWSPGLVAAAVFSYSIRMWAITVGFHRYFSHRSFKTSRTFQFILAFIGMCSAQKGVLWWAAHHRHHHRHADHEPDIHSPTLRGFLWSHMGWFLCTRYDDTDFEQIKDFAKYPELRWMNRWEMVPSIAVGALVWAIWGWPVFVWAGLVATTVLWHGTFVINSLCHVFGKRRFATTDTSKNSLILALITFGEGWHNNHHFFPSSARQGFYWWEIDLSYYSLKVLEKLGIVWDIRGVPESVLARGREADAQATA